jgi:hypothetical protein
MNPAMQNIFGNSNQRGFRLRCFLDDALVVSVILSLQSPLAHAQGIVDCVDPASLSVSRVQGQVFDPSGTVVSGVSVTLVDVRSADQRTTTDNQGRFHVDALPDQYIFNASLPPFRRASAKLAVLGREDVGPRPGYFYVILGTGGSFCPWVTASRREFQKIIHANQRRMKEAAQANATQK